jgi:hypothetical protein
MRTIRGPDASSLQRTAAVPRRVSSSSKKCGDAAAMETSFDRGNRAPDDADILTETGREAKPNLGIAPNDREDP